MDAEAMKSTLQQEETSHAEDKHRLETAVKALEATNNSLQVWPILLYPGLMKEKTTLLKQSHFAYNSTEQNVN